MKPQYIRSKKNKKCNASIKIIDIRAMNKIKDEWKTEKSDCLYSLY